MGPDDVGAILMDAVRRAFEAQSAHPGPRFFEGVVEWEIAVGHDDSDERVRLTVLAGMSTWSERNGGRVRPTVRMVVDADVQPHPPQGRPPRVVRYDDLPSDPLRQAKPLETPPDRPAGRLADRLMRRYGGHDLQRDPNGSLSFTVTLPDEPPWVA
jgi:hypothetical protein